MSKLDPLLKYYAATWPSADTADVALEGAAPGPVPPAGTVRRQNVMVELESDGEDLPQALTALGFVLRTRAGTVLTGDIPRDALPQLEGIPGLKRAEASRPLRRELDFACPEARVAPVTPASRARPGAGVIVALIDHGVDYRHPSFRNADGTSRILAIWDQALKPEQGETSPDGFGYGVEFKQHALNKALDSKAPLSKVRHRDTQFHGTHVAGIAAGNGTPAAGSGEAVRFVGVAPHAALIVVANTRTNSEDPGSLGDSADTLDAIHYILEIAKREGKPVVINQSQGDNIGPHDGTSLLEVGIANLIKGPGRVLIKSAGNEANRGSHAEGVLAVGGSDDVKIEIPPGQDQLIIDLWYPGANRIGVSITPPSGAAAGPFDAAFSKPVTFANGNRGFIDLDLNDPGNNENRIFMVLEPGAQGFLEEGIWTFRLNGSGPWHAWIQIDSGARFLPPFVQRAGTISIPGTTDAVITVGAYVSRTSLTEIGDLSEFSGCGPTRDGRQAPTLCAPGEELTAPLALRPDGESDSVFFTPSRGTSISAPMVAGAAALMFAINPALTAADIRRGLEESARQDDQTGPTPNNAWGAGKLDVVAACQFAEATRT